MSRFGELRVRMRLTCGVKWDSSSSDEVDGCRTRDDALHLVGWALLDAGPGL